MTSKNVCHLLNVYLEKCGCFGHHSLFCCFLFYLFIILSAWFSRAPIRKSKDERGSQLFPSTTWASGLHLACHVWQQTPLLAEPSCWPISLKQLNLTNYHIIHSLNKYVWRNPSVLACLAPQN